MAVIPDFKATTLTAFVKQHVTPGSTIYTDGLKQFTGLPVAGFKHVARTQPLREDLRKGAHSVVPLADRAIGNLQQWLIGTHHGVSRGAAPGLPRRVRVSAQSAADSRRPPFRRCSASGPGARRRRTDRFGALGTCRRPTG